MQVLGIIAEYNPFHNGHLYHLKRSKEVTGADVTVAVMSGNFVQRGEPALLNKWLRSEAAVRNGVDLVLELPFAYSCNNAEIFGNGSIDLLDRLGIIDCVSFGSESGDLESLNEVADILVSESPEFSEKIKKKMKEGFSYPKARYETVSEIIGEEKSSLLNSPNNILALEYLKQLKLKKSKIKPYTVRRYKASLDEADEKSGIAGATAIRDMIQSDDMGKAMDFLPKESRLILSTNVKEISDYNMFIDILLYSIISKSKDELNMIYSITEGLESRVIQGAKQVGSVNDLIDFIKSKRYTETRIKRILIHILLNLTRKKMSKIISERQMYGRVLGFSETGASLLKDIKRENLADIPIITNISKESDMLKDSMDLFEYDLRSTDIYNLVVSKDIYEKSDYRRIPAYIKAQ